jgi:hypothetical protein
MKAVDYDPTTGITETFVKDAVTGEIKVNHSQDVDPVFINNARDRNAASSDWKGDFHKVASVPLIVVQMWREELKASGAANVNPLAKENKSWLIAKLNSRDFLKLRTKDGHI